MQLREGHLTDKEIKHFLNMPLESDEAVRFYSIFVLRVMEMKKVKRQHGRWKKLVEYVQRERILTKEEIEEIKSRLPKKD